MQQNLGSLVRSAYFLGAAGVLCCARNSAPLSPAVAKASSGALEMLPLHSCTNLMRTLQTASDAGWLVLGAGPCLVSSFFRVEMWFCQSCACCLASVPVVGP